MAYKAFAFRDFISVLLWVTDAFST